MSPTNGHHDDQTKSRDEQVNQNPDDTTSLQLRTLGSISEIDGHRWDELATSLSPYNPLISHCFLQILEESGSVKRETGWMPHHLLLEKNNEIIGLAPAYLKGHSQGEYVFDHHWADAYERAGGRYFPKLVIASPFSPVPGPRLLCADAALYPLFGQAIAQLTDKLQLSSAHINFILSQEQDALADVGFLPRLGEQFHWKNKNYQNFDEFLAELSSRKRKTIRAERRKASAGGIRVQNYRGNEISPEYWDKFWIFYQDTGARKWGSPYLTRECFTLMSERMGEDLLMTLAFEPDNPDPIAAALHLIGGDTLYGRYWGCAHQAKFLHFECCYYQAIDFAIENGLARVEAGAQGHHKLARGYEPVATYSAHFIPNPSFKDAIENYLDHERRHTEQEIEALKNFTPFKKGP